MTSVLMSLGCVLHYVQICVTELFAWS